MYIFFEVPKMWYVRKHLISYQGVTRFCQHFMNLIFNYFFRCDLCQCCLRFFKNFNRLTLYETNTFLFWMLHFKWLKHGHKKWLVLLRYTIWSLSYVSSRRTFIELLEQYQWLKRVFRWSFKNTVSHNKFTIMFM